MKDLHGMHYLFEHVEVFVLLLLDPVLDLHEVHRPPDDLVVVR